VKLRRGRRGLQHRLEVVGERELRFFPGIARGCVYPGFHYRNEAGSFPAPLRFIHPFPSSADEGMPSSPPPTLPPCRDLVAPDAWLGKVK
jgi:Biotin-protein ligase, N terminal